MRLARWLLRKVEHPTLLSVSVQVLGWGPSVTVYYWDRRSDYGAEWSWRYAALCAGPFELDVQWL